MGSAAFQETARAGSGARSDGTRDGAPADATATAAHDLQTPAAIILGLCSRIEDGGLTAEQAADLERVRLQAAAVSRTALELLETTPATPPAARRQEIDVAAVARAVADEVAVLAHARGAIVLVSAEAPAMVRAEEGELNSAITNLVTNAVRQVESGGCVRCSVRRSDDGVEIEVADSGPGIPESERDALLDPFTQGTGARGKTGLGLAIVRETAARLDGSIAVGDAPEGGAAFTLTLPEVRRPTRPGRRRRRAGQPG